MLTKEEIRSIDSLQNSDWQEASRFDLMLDYNLGRYLGEIKIVFDNKKEKSFKDIIKAIDFVVKNQISELSIKYYKNIEV
jgi:hypothetical protein